MRRFGFYAKRQAGGTVTGLIVGLIIGLSIAVVVGLTIMKMPLPFVDRLGMVRPGRERDNKIAIRAGSANIFYKIGPT